jgi:hypothetical protein
MTFQLGLEKTVNPDSELKCHHNFLLEVSGCLLLHGFLDGKTEMLFTDGRDGRPL